MFSERENLSQLNGDRTRLVKRQSAANSETGSIVVNANDTSFTSKFEDDQTIWTTTRHDRPELDQNYHGPMANEQLLDGFMLLRLMQLLNIDIYYIGLISDPKTKHQLNKLCDQPTKDDGRPDGGPSPSSLQDLEAALSANSATKTTTDQSSSFKMNQTGNIEENGGIAEANTREPSIMEEVAKLNPIKKFIDRSRFLQAFCRCMKIFLSLIALLFSFDKTLSTILLCLLAKISSNSPSIGIKAPSVGMTNEASDISMSWFVLILVNLSSTYIMYSTIFNGHLLWNLLSQRLFLVSRRFQYKTMLSLLIFVYLDYIINIAFINNLFGWSMIKSDLDSNGFNNGNGGGSNLYGGYSVLNSLRKFVTEQDEEHHVVDIILTIIQFARGLIRISPYLTINYVIICLVEHIETIRNQNLLTDSLKKRQKLRLVVKNRRANLRASRLSHHGRLSAIATNVNGTNNMANNKKKRVIFVTETIGSGLVSNGSNNQLNNLQADTRLRQLQAASPTPSSSSSNYYPTMERQLATSSPASIGNRSVSSLSDGRMSNLMVLNEDVEGYNKASRLSACGCGNRRIDYLNRIRDFDELESYVTNLYIFTGRLNRLMSRQGLAMYFIVHNLVISCALIVPEAIRGGPPMVLIIRLIVIIIGIVPFVCGQSLNDQLEQLSKQIDRIIIQQQFTNRRRDNLVRIRELLHDIRVNCGGMLNFNVETGIKYLVVAFASAFFIEQEDYKLTRRH